MGLSIARKLAVSMDGDITVESTMGVGSTFTFTCVLDRPAPRRYVRAMQMTLSFVLADRTEGEPAKPC